MREKSGLIHKGSGRANRSELGRGENGRPGLQFTVVKLRLSDGLAVERHEGKVKKK